MEDYFLLIKMLVFSLLYVILYLVLRVVHVYWVRPRSLEKLLRKQGIRGRSYKLLHDDMKEMSTSSREAWSKPMSLNHQIAPRVLPYFHQMVQKYEKVSLGWMETRPRLIVTDPDLIKDILINKNGHFIMPPLNPLVKLLQLGVATLEGEQWTKRRRIINPAFHLEKLMGMEASFVTGCSDMIDRWEKLIGVEGSREVDVAPEFQKLSSEVIALTAFGCSFEDGKLIELQKKQAALLREAYYGFYFPGFRFIPTKKNRLRYKVDNEIKAILRATIRKKEQAMENGEVGANNDLLGLLLQCKAQEENSMTIEDVIEECKSFYFAGQESIATLLTWTMILLCMHPNWQEKAREEVLRVFGKKTPDLHGIKQLKIVSMILTEVLRLYPSLVLLFRHSHQKTTVGGLSIPAGVDFVFPILFLHHDPKYWGEDVEEFNPERFSEGVVKASKDQTAFFSFGWGPRLCLGQTFAMLEGKVALAMILQHFSLELSPSYTHAPVISISVKPKHGAPIIVHRIQDAEIVAQ